MDLSEFLTVIKSKGAFIWGPSNPRAIEYTNVNLQQNKCAALPNFMINLYTKTAGINLGSGYIFGPSELPNGIQFPIPSIIQVNQDMRGIPELQNKTVFARNDLFLFAFDVFGTCYMLNNANGAILRKYDEPYRALYDCLMGGQI